MEATALVRDRVEKAQDHFRNTISLVAETVRRSSGESGHADDDDGRQAPSYGMLRRVGLMNIVDLGPNARDEADAANFRRTTAARRIQKEYRVHLTRKRYAEERARANEARRNAAAAVIQAGARGMRDRRRFAEMKVDRLVERVAVMRISRAYIRHVHRRAAARRRAAMIEANRVRAREERVAASARAAASHRDMRAALDAGGDISASWKAATAIQSRVRVMLAVEERRRRMAAIACIQRHYRGSRGRRRASILRAVRASRSRRDVCVGVARHIDLLREVRPLESRLMHAWFVGNIELEAAMRTSFLASETLENEWYAWKQKFYRRALNKGLPKGWCPRSLGNTGRVYYIHVRSGRSQLVHPNLMDVADAAAEKRAALEKRGEEDMRAVREHTFSVRQAVANELAVILKTFDRWRLDTM